MAEAGEGLTPDQKFLQRARQQQQANLEVAKELADAEAVVGGIESLPPEVQALINAVRADAVAKNDSSWIASTLRVEGLEDSQRFGILTERDRVLNGDYGLKDVIQDESPTEGDQ